MVPTASLESALTWSAWGMIITGVATVISCLYMAAPYGRYSESKGWGFLIPAPVAWFLMESPNLIITVFCMMLHEGPLNQTNKVFLSFFILHYIQRTIIYPFRMSPKCNPMPVSIMLAAFTYTSWNGFNMAVHLCFVASYPDEWLHDIRFIIGSAMFFIGMAINIQSDGILLTLKSQAQNDASSSKDKSSGMQIEKNRYKIPTGGLFGLVSCANYFGEIVEWVGYAIMCWSLVSAAFAFYVACNLAPRAYKVSEGLLCVHMYVCVGVGVCV